MNKVTKIPAGYRLTVVSWENDGDNYNTKVLEGLSRETCQMYVDLCKLLGVSNGHRDRNLSNLYEPSEDQIEKLTDAFMPIVAKYLHTVIPLEDIEDATNKEYVCDYIMSVLYDLGLSCGEWYTRVCESVTIELVPQDVLFEDVTKEFVS